tara:strand:- start:103 stop:591 length:489 start_codon:yes stop_codon:yes gene_type:complete
MNIKKDTIVAIFLLLFCGIMINSSFDIEDPGYQGMKASFWPTIVLCLLSIMCLVMLIKSVVTEAENNLNSNDTNLTNVFFKFKNASICFLMFVLFLAFLDYLGMLIGGVLFVFGLLTMLGGFELKKIINHFIISIITIGIMWSIFTFGLKVILPEGEILRIW